jgi:hypothetical protein
MLADMEAIPLFVSKSQKENHNKQMHWTLLLRASDL